MKLLVVLTLIACFYGAEGQQLCEKNYIASHMVLTKEEEALGQIYCEECMQETNVTFAALTAVEMKQITAPEYSTNCYYQCYFSKINTWDIEGNANLEPLETRMTMRNYMSIVMCEQYATETDGCERSFNWYNCFLRNL